MAWVEVHVEVQLQLQFQLQLQLQVQLELQLQVEVQLQLQLQVEVQVLVQVQLQFRLQLQLQLQLQLRLQLQLQLQVEVQFQLQLQVEVQVQLQFRLQLGSRGVRGEFEEGSRRVRPERFEDGSRNLRGGFEEFLEASSRRARRGWFERGRRASWLMCYADPERNHKLLAFRRRNGLINDHHLVFGKTTVVFCYHTPDRSALTIRENLPIQTNVYRCFTCVPQAQWIDKRQSSRVRQNNSRVLLPYPR